MHDCNTKKRHDRTDHERAEMATNKKMKMDDGQGAMVLSTHGDVDRKKSESRLHYTLLRHQQYRRLVRGLKRSRLKRRSSHSRRCCMCRDWETVCYQSLPSRTLVGMFPSPTPGWHSLHQKVVWSWLEKELDRRFTCWKPSHHRGGSSELWDLCISICHFTWHNNVATSVRLSELSFNHQDGYRWHWQRTGFGQHHHSDGTLFWLRFWQTSEITFS